MSPSSRTVRGARAEHRRRHAGRTPTQDDGHARLAAKKGRHPKLTRSEQRKLARLYTYTELSTEDICEVLKRLHGKNISVRCAQNNIQQVLQTSSLVSVRPRNRTECQLRIRQTPRHQVTANVRKLRAPYEPSKEMGSLLLPSQLFPIEDLTWGQTDGPMPDPPSSEVPWSPPHHQRGNFLMSRDTMDNSALSGLSADVAWLSEHEPTALGRTGDIDLTFSNLNQGFSEPFGLAVASQELDFQRESTNTISAGLSATIMPQAAFTAGLVSENLVPGHNMNDPIGSSGYVGGHWSWAAEPSAGHIYGPVGFRHLPLRDPGNTLETTLAEDVHGLNESVTTLGSPPTSNAFIPSHKFLAIPRADVTEASPEHRINSERDTEEPGSLQGFSKAASLGSLRRQLSYSSSRMSDIMTVFTRFSLSSKLTRSSSHVSSSLGHIDQASWTGPQETSLDTLCTMKHPLELPGNFMEFGGTALTISSRCDECFFQLADSLCTRCSQLAEFILFIKDCRDFEGLAAQWPVFGVDLYDRFYNTGLHIAAANGAGCEVLIALMKRGMPLNAVNTAGQTLLHVMDPRALLKYERDLPALLTYLLRSGFDFHKVDHQGVNVLQALLQYPIHHATMNSVFAALGSQLSMLASRDNLGRTWQSRVLFLAYDAVEGDPKRSKALNEIILKFDGCLFSPDSLAFEEVPSASSDKDHSLLESLVTRALNEPLVEDLYGRNGLHCIAEVSLKQPGTSAGPSKDTAARRQRRESYFVRLLAAGVDVNAYDKAGNTPLIAFLQTSQIRVDGYDKGHIEFYLTELIKAGACVNSRNRSGESALHVAIALGIISATRVLIKVGANIHVRQKDCKGVVKLGLETAQKMEQKTKLQKSLHIRIMTCINIARNRGAVDDPTVFQEWDVSPGSEEKLNFVSKIHSSRLGQSPNYQSQYFRSPPRTADFHSGFF